MNQSTVDERASEWLEMLRLQKESHLSVNDWCKENHLGPDAFYYRRRQLNRMGIGDIDIHARKRSDASPEFVELSAAEPTTSGSAPALGSFESCTASIQFRDTMIRLTNAASPELITAGYWGQAPGRKNKQILKYL